jgi:hypothetical protein
LLDTITSQRAPVQVCRRAESVDMMPGNVMMQDITKMQNEYMNKSGCDILMHDQDELMALGPDYYKKFFPEEEAAWIVKGTMDLYTRQDITELFNFFQQVRPHEDEPFKWYFTISKLYQRNPDEPANKIIHIANEVNTLGDICSKVNRLLEGWAEWTFWLE